MSPPLDLFEIIAYPVPVCPPLSICMDFVFFPYGETSLPRTTRNAKLDTRSARLKLSERREPYWHVLSKGCALGYRRGANGGNWIARLRDEAGKQHYEALGAADDVRDTDNLTVFTFNQAQERARAWFASKARELAGHAEPQMGPFTVAAAISEYLTARERKGSKGVRKDQYAADARIVPTLGAIEAPKNLPRAVFRIGYIRSPPPQDLSAPANSRQARRGPISTSPTTKKFAR